jgi:hypothetical protein
LFSRSSPPPWSRQQQADEPLPKNVPLRPRYQLPALIPAWDCLAYRWSTLEREYRNAGIRMKPRPNLVEHRKLLGNWSHLQFGAIRSCEGLLAQLKWCMALTAPDASASSCGAGRLMAGEQEDAGGHKRPVGMDGSENRPSSPFWRPFECAELPPCPLRSSSSLFHRSDPSFTNTQCGAFHETILMTTHSPRLESKQAVYERSQH